MIKILKYFFIISISLLVVIMVSCSTCNEQMTSNRSVKLKFAKISGKTFADSTVSILEIITFNSRKTDSVYSEVLNLSLPLDEGNDSSTFVIYTDSVSYSKTHHIDTLIFYYKTDLVLISPDCGFNERYTNIKLVPKNHNRIDTVITNSTGISSDPGSLNFTIVLKVNPPE